ncbi:MAG TPA: DUF6351 family protein [Methylomirabilota bacterium]|nr:DUF6351 family protein [Methylomirabilota bacterium]
MTALRTTIACVVASLFFLTQVPSALAGGEHWWFPGWHRPTLTCEELVDGFHKNQTTITSATLVPAADPAPEYCDVRGLIGNAPEPGKGIRFAVWLPVEASWNKRFYMVGGGGYAGGLSLTAMRAGLNQGYATATTDTGHDAAVFPLATFAYNDPTSEKDYSYRAVHETVITAKELIKTHYGERPRYNYWVGCSTGGRQGLMEAQRFPHDFDGLITGAPVLEFTDTQIGGLWNAKSLMGAGAIPLSKLPVLAASELAKCDGSDGLVDGQITDPRLCNFDPLADLPACPGDVDGAGCFTFAQRDAVRKVYDGPRTSSGHLIFPGYAVGTAVFGPASGWIPWFILPGSPASLLELFGESFMQFMAFTPDPGPTYVWEDEFDFDRDPFRMRRIRRILDADDPDLSHLKRRGGKIIQYHGWADAALTPYMSINYYESVRATMGHRRTEDFYKLYMAPGMFHCGGGPGPNVFDVFTPLVNWVEHHIEPQEIIATNPVSGRTRPLCPYPQIAQYQGGNPEVAASFACANP